MADLKVYLKELVMKEFLRIFYELDERDPRDTDLILEFPCGSRIEFKLIVSKSGKLKLVKTG